MRLVSDGKQTWAVALGDCSGFQMYKKDGKGNGEVLTEHGSGIEYPGTFSSHLKFPKEGCNSEKALAKFMLSKKGHNLYEGSIENLTGGAMMEAWQTTGFQNLPKDIIILKWLCI